MRAPVHWFDPQLDPDRWLADEGEVTGWFASDYELLGSANNTTALNGISSATSVGALNVAHAVIGLAGQSATAAAGTAVASDGSGLINATGTPTGAASTSSAGSSLILVSAVPTGVASTTAAGALSSAFANIGLEGLSATAAAGTAAGAVSGSTNTTATPTGVASTAAAGTTLILVSAVPVGVAGTTTAGACAIVANAAVAPTGVEATAAAGSAAGVISCAPAGVDSTCSAGTTATVATAIVEPAGIATTTAVGALDVTTGVGIDVNGFQNSSVFGAYALDARLELAGFANASAFGLANVGNAISPPQPATPPFLGEPHAPRFQHPRRERPKRVPEPELQPHALIVVGLANENAIGAPTVIPMPTHALRPASTRAWQRFGAVRTKWRKPPREIRFTPRAPAAPPVAVSTPPVAALGVKALKVRSALGQVQLNTPASPAPRTTIAILSASAPRPLRARGVRSVAAIGSPMALPIPACHVPTHGLHAAGVPATSLLGTPRRAPPRTLLWTRSAGSAMAVGRPSIAPIARAPTVVAHAPSAAPLAPCSHRDMEVMGRARVEPARYAVVASTEPLAPRAYSAAQSVGRAAIRQPVGIASTVNRSRAGIGALLPTLTAVAAVPTARFGIPLVIAIVAKPVLTRAQRDERDLLEITRLVA